MQHRNIEIAELRRNKRTSINSQDSVAMCVNLMQKYKLALMRQKVNVLVVLCTKNIEVFENSDV